MEPESDVDIGRWVFEFLLHQDLEYTLLSSLAKCLPLPLKSYSLDKAIVLRHLRHHLSSASSSSSSSDAVLRLLHQLEELEYQNGRLVCGDFKAAYYAALGAYAVGFLKEKKDYKQCYSEMKKVWKLRVGRGALFMEVGMVAKEFLEWKDAVVEMVLGGAGGGGLEAVRVYVDREMEKLGPSFLERVAGDEAVMSIISADRREGIGALLDVSREGEPEIEADARVVALCGNIDELPTPELTEGRLPDNLSSSDLDVSYMLDSKATTKKRRLSKIWSKEEEDILRKAVKKYGKGKWKIILYAYQHIFLERTEGDLKDKWRNMSHK